MSRVFLSLMLFFGIVQSINANEVAARSEKITEFSFILDRSEIAGIGLFITHPVSKGAVLYVDHDKEVVRPIEGIPPQFLKFCMYTSTTECQAPERYDLINVWWYLNHSHQPNITIRESDHAYIAIRDIQANEEILIDYNDFNEPEEMKEDYFRRPLKQCKNSVDKEENSQEI